MKEKIIAFLKKYPELLFDILELAPDKLSYSINTTQSYRLELNYFEFGSLDFSFLSKHEKEIREYFQKKLNRAISIRLNKKFSFLELEDERIKFLETEGKTWDKNTYEGIVKWSKASCEIGPWSIKIIERFKEKWDWASLSRNQMLQLDTEIVEAFEDRWEWDHGLDWHQHLPQEEGFFIKYWKRLSFKRSRIPSIELKNNSNNFTPKELSDLSENVNIKWERDFIEKNYLDKSKFTKEYHALAWRALSLNPSLPWSIPFIIQFEKNWDWEYLSQNPALPWSEKLLEMFSSKWDWSGISSNKGLPWSRELILKYENNFMFNQLSQNGNIPWDMDLIKQFEEKWDWDRLSMQEDFPWTKLLFEKYYNKIVWEGAMYESKDGDFDYRTPAIIKNKNIVLDRSMMLFFKNKWKLYPKNKYGENYLGEWNKISYNYILNIDLVEEYFETFDINYLIENKSLKSFELIEIIESKLGRKKFLEFLDEKDSIPYTYFNNRTITNKEKIWQGILRFYIDEEIVKKCIVE